MYEEQIAELKALIETINEKLKTNGLNEKLEHERLELIDELWHLTRLQSFQISDNIDENYGDEDDR